MLFNFPSFILATNLRTGARISAATANARNGLKNAAIAADMT